MWIRSLTNNLLTPSEAAMLAVTCPEDMRIVSKEEKSILLINQAIRPSSPEVFTDLMSRYPDTFKDNWVFISCGKSSESPFIIHRDPVDVLLVCLHGTMEVSEWDYDGDDREFNYGDPKAKIKDSTILYPGDAALFTKGTYHHVKPSPDRVSATLGFTKEYNVQNFAHYVKKS